MVHSFFGRESSPEFVVDVPRSVVAIYAHPDDSDVSCGGTLARWADLGSAVHVVICALGDKGSSDPDCDVDALVAQRKGELAAAASALGIQGVHQLGFRDGEFENDLVLREELVGLIRSVRPDVLVCPDPESVFFGEHYYNHRDHRVVGFAALDAAAPAASAPLYFPRSGPATTVPVAYLSGSLEPNVFVDVTTTIDRKAAAVMCHKSQLGDSGESLRTVFHERAEDAGRLSGVPFAEAFRRIYLA